MRERLSCDENSISEKPSKAESWGIPQKEACGPELDKKELPVRCWLRAGRPELLPRLFSWVVVWPWVSH